MNFSKITITNFRQYYGKHNIDLETNETQNIVLFGGKNGYGKTNFLLAIVWCLYGEKISQIDDHFKKEIQKEKNYQSFMQQSLNWQAKDENKNYFSMSIIISNLNTSLENEVGIQINNITITRSFDVIQMSESLSITDTESGKEIFEDENDKMSFIYEYILPIEAAKFVFFDAEKIAQIANLSMKDEGSFINDALGKILGLDVYMTLIEDLEIYINNLKKEGANKNLQELISDRERLIKISVDEIDKLEEDNAEKLKEIDSLKKKIREYDNLISQHTKKGNSLIEREKIIAEIEKLNSQKFEFTEKFNEMSEFIPLILLFGKIEEVIEHIEHQKHNSFSKMLQSENNEKVEKFVEQLFNKPPEPENSSMTFQDKSFYYNKAKQIAKDLFNEEIKINELDFEHDLNNFEQNLIKQIESLIKTKDKELFKFIIEENNRTSNRLNELNNLLNKIDADLIDELVLEYRSKKESAEISIREITLIEGENKQKIKKLESDINRSRQEISGLIKKVDINARNKEKIAVCNLYIETLQEFIEEQKNIHKDNIEKNILNELKNIMHKLKTNNGSNILIEDVKVTILAASQGMLVNLFDQNKNEIKKEVLSSGEKQLYISCLIKALLKESINSLPIFIDTPLGRLDEDHRDNILTSYYLSLSDQVVLFSTDSEITPKRYKEILPSIAKSYILENDGINTKIVNGYFG